MVLVLDSLCGVAHFSLTGAPDPTAGGREEDEPASWHLDETRVRDRLQQQLCQPSQSSVARDINTLLHKVC